MPVRAIRMNYRFVTGRIPSQKNSRIICYESPLERDFFRLQEFDFNVEAYEEQPVQIRWSSGGKDHSYVPDALVTYRSGRTPALIEVKPRQELRENWTALRLSIFAGLSYARARGWKFRVWTDRDIRTPYLQNVIKLLPYRRTPHDEDLCQELIDDIRRAGSCDVATLLRGREYDPPALAAIHRIIAIGAVHADLTVPLTFATVVRRAEP